MLYALCMQIEYIWATEIYCQTRGPDHVQVNSRRLQGLKKLLVILKSKGLDVEIDSIIGRYHHHPYNFLDVYLDSSKYY